VKRRFVGLDNSFARGNWTFAKPDIGGDTIIVNGVNIIQDFYGLCVGDVNGSNIPDGGAKSINNFYLEYKGEIAALPGALIQLPIRIDRALDVSAISLSLDLSLGLFHVEGVKAAIGNVIFNTIGDNLRIVWSELEGLELQAGDTLLNLTLLINDISTIHDLTPFILNDGCELADLKGDPISGITLITSYLGKALSIEESIIKGLAIYPNPSSEKVTIHFQLASSSHIDCYLSDMTGKKVLTAFSQSFGHGLNEKIVDVSNLLPGIYIVCFNVNEGLRLQTINKRLAVF